MLFKRGIAVGLAVALILLGVAELIARQVTEYRPLPSPPPEQRIDPYSGNPYLIWLRPWLHTFLPGSRYQAARSSYVVDYEINDRGFRGPEAPPRHGPRLVVVGDSIAEGHGVRFEEAFPFLLGVELAEEGWEVVNAGVQGASPIYFAANLPRYLALEPDAVLLVLFENDLGDDHMKEETHATLPFVDDSRRLVGERVEEQLRLLTLARRVHSRLFPGQLARTVAANRARHGEIDFLLPASDHLVRKEAFATRWEMSAAYLDLVADALQERGIPLLVAVLATGTRVPGGGAERTAHADAFEEYAASWAAARDVPAFSLYPVVDEAWKTFPRWEEVLLEDDGHPTPRLHAAFAAKLGSWLRAALP